MAESASAPLFATPTTGTKKSRDIKGAARTIFIAVALPCVPILSIVITLFVFILIHRVDLGTGYPELQGPVNNKNESLFHRLRDGGPVIYVKFSATSLTTLASWTSRVIPYLTGSIMAMVAFLAARHLARRSEHTSASGLPSPPEFALLLDLLSGDSFVPLWSTIMYRYETKRKLVAPIPAAFWSLLTLTLLGLLIPLIDTWFGVATTADGYESVHRTPPIAIQPWGWMFDSSGQCVNGPNDNGTTYWPCSMTIVDRQVTFPKSMDSLTIQYTNLIDAGMIITPYDPGSQKWYYYASTEAIPMADFTAFAPAISTQCVPMTQKCLNSTSDGSFQCSPGFSGKITGAVFPESLYPCQGDECCTGDICDGLSLDNSNLGISFSNTSDLLYKPPLVSTGESGLVKHQTMLSQNPQYFGTWAVDYPDAATLETAFLMRDDPDILQLADNSTVWFLNCSTTVANATFTMVNGSVIDFNPIELHDHDMATFFTAPFNLFPYNQVLGSSMARLATVALTGGNMGTAANIWAEEFSKTALALATGSFVPANNVVQQSRVAEGILTRLPLVPFSLLIALKLLYVLVVIGLAVTAYVFTEPAETEVIQQQLSTKAILAAYFDDPAILQKNAVKTVQDLPHNSEKMDEKGSRATEVTSAEVKHDEDVRIGLKQDTQGMWKHVLLIDGVWQSIKPLAKIA